MVTTKDITTVDGLYTVMDGAYADILYQGEISSGYGSDGPLFYICIGSFLKNRVHSWSDDPSWKKIYFINPKLITPINLIKWED